MMILTEAMMVIHQDHIMARTSWLAELVSWESCAQFRSVLPGVIVRTSIFEYISV